MEEEDTVIIQVTFKFEDGRLYSFDVEHTTTLQVTRKILSNAAHILKNSFTLFHEGQEVPKDHDPLPLKSLFPSMKKIEFYLKLKKTQEDVDENEHENISVKYNIKEPCKEHIGKFLVLYCLSCKKSICNECFSLSHNNHEVEEKADYLMPSNTIMDRIFKNSSLYKSDPKISNYMSCVSFRSIIKTDIFDRLRLLINELENKTINCLEFFSFNEDTTEKNNDLNLELLKKYCTASFIKLKNNIDIKDILIDDDVFLSLYNKLKAIKDYQMTLFTENANKYKALNSFFLPFTQEIKNMSNDLNNILLRYINKDIYAKFKEDVARNVVDVVQKEDVVRFMFENVNVAKTKLTTNSSLMKPDELSNNMNKNSLTPNMTQRLLPSILLLNEQKNINLAANTTSNINNINNNSKQSNNFNIGIGSNVNNNITNNTAMNLSKNFQQVKDNLVITSPIHFSQTRSDNFNIVNNNNVTSTNNVSSKNMLMNSTSNISNMNTMINNVPSYTSSNIASTMNNNNNLNSAKSSKKSNTNVTSNNTNNIVLLQSGEKDSDKLKHEKSDIMEVEEIQNSPNQKRQDMINYSEAKIEEIKANLSEKNTSSINNCSSPLMKKTLINIRLSPNKREDNFDNRSVILSQNYLQQKGLFSQTSSKERNNIEFATTTQTKIETHTTNIRNSINDVSIFSGKLIDVLNKEKDNTINNINNMTNNINNTNVNTSMELELNKENNINNNASNSIKEEVQLSQKAEMGSNKKKSNFSAEEFIQKSNEKEKEKEKEPEKVAETPVQNQATSQNIPLLSFMYPVFKTNIVKGAVDKNTVREIKITFPGEMTEFFQGGAYCNYENSLYITGGKDYIKDAGKSFIYINTKELGQNAKKLPEMKFSHSNHSMIGNKGKLYVIGGINSNKCEVFDIASQTWAEIPDLIEKERQRSMLFIDNNFLYCFMGRTQNGFLTSVERLNLDNISAGWENIIVNTGSERINLKFYGAGIIRRNNSNKIYFIGGKKEKRNKEEGYKRSIFEFSFDDFKITKSDFKIENDLIFIENKLFAMDESDCGNFINVGNGFLISMPNLQ